VYKLTDFGSAREFDDNELFMSMYGTEEYLVSSSQLSFTVNAHYTVYLLAFLLLFIQKCKIFRLYMTLTMRPDSFYTP